MPYALIALVLACGVMGALLRSSYVTNGEIAAELSTATEALSHAKAEAETLAAASRGHAAELARLRKGAAGDSVAVRKATGDCLDVRHGNDIGAVLRGVRPADKGGAPKPAAPG